MSQEDKEAAARWEKARAAGAEAWADANLEAGVDLTLPGIDAVVAALGDAPHKMRVQFLVTGRAALGGISPQDALRAGRQDEAIEQARRFVVDR